MSTAPRVTTDLVEAAQAILEGAGTREAKLQAVCRLLADRVAHYDWVGFYLTDPASERELVLGPYVGQPTDHVRIPFGRGICGQAAEREQTCVVQDVSQQENYLSCSPAVKAEIVVPMLREGRVVGELDIDSHTRAPFRDEDRQALERIAKRAAALF